MKGLIFDLDGTLLDTLEDLGRSMNAVLLRHGFPGHRPEDFRRKVGNGMRVLVERSLPPGTAAETVVRCLEAMRAEYRAHLLDHSPPYPGVEELLSRLRATAWQLAVLTNKPQDMAEQLVAHRFPPDTFQAVVGGQPGRPLKPDPTAARDLLETLGRPATTWLAGDSGVDVQTAQAAGLPSIGCAWGFRDSADLNGATVIVHHPLEILQVV